MPVIYDGKKIIPAPFVSLEKQIEKREDGKTVKMYWRITLKGKFVAYKGGVGWTQPGYPPDQSQYLAEIDRMEGIVDKLGALQELFLNSNEGKLLEIQPPNGSAAIKCNPRIIGISYPEGLWVDSTDYTVSLEADKVHFPNHLTDSVDEPLAPNEESWQIEQGEGGSYRFTHTVSASEKLSYNDDGTINQQAWQKARERVIASLGINTGIMMSTDIMNLSENSQAYNYTRSESINETQGSVSVTETWLVYDEENAIDLRGPGIPCLDVFTVSINQDVETKRTRVSLEGTLTGLEERNNQTFELISTKYNNAQNKFNAITEPGLFDRAQTFSGVTLNPKPLNYVVGKNPESGVLTYSREYDDRPGDEEDNTVSVQISDRLPTDVIAKLGVMNRSLGPIFQDMNTVTEKSRALQIEVTMEAQKYGQPHPQKPDVSAYIALYGPGGEFGFNATVGPKIERNEENWQPRDGRYSRSIGWTYE